MRAEVRGSLHNNRKCSNYDSDTDLDDYAAFTACMTGPGGGKFDGCDLLDLDEDHNVDPIDYEWFQRVLTGSD